MARIEGVNVPDNKVVGIALTYVRGIGRPTATQIVEKAGIEWGKRVKDLTEDELNSIRDIIKSDEYIVEGDLQRQVSENIKRLTDLKCYRGLRHRNGLPVRGQRTKTNARTRKGKKKTVAGKKK